MRSLFVMRHGKSDRNQAELDDHERPLKPRGRRAAERMGRLLTESENAPELVLSSTALRARHTAELAHTAGAWTCPLEGSRSLYLASAQAMLLEIQQVAAALQRVLVVAHEPGCSQLVGALTGGPPPRFPTAALARIDLDLPDWSALREGAGGLAWLIPPAAL